MTNVEWRVSNVDGQIIRNSTLETRHCASLSACFCRNLLTFGEMTLWQYGWEELVR
jgi:hypothetical protein